MGILETALLVTGIVLFSAVIDQLLARVSIPLIQIALGLIAAVLSAGELSFDLDAELFLVLLIAPLLFNESRKVDKSALMRNLPGILSLAIGLVVVSMLAVGFTLHWIEPSIPLAAAFALGAALGPTDAVAVSSLSGSIRLNERQHALLSGESLINDASGVVSFQFATAAALTGAFSLIDATETFFVSFGGGLLLGAATGILALAVLRAVRAMGLESPVFHVVFELGAPFAIYLLAEGVGVSGILAVVAAGLIMALVPRRASYTTAQVGIVSGNVWEVFSFLLNGTVFVFLGMQLPKAVMPSWEGSASISELLVLVAGATIAVVGTRFLWLLAMGAIHGRGTDRSKGGTAREALATTLAGPKGAVTLSIAFTLPATLLSGAPFPWHDELLFIASGAILCTLLLANFAVPVLSPNENDEQAEHALILAQIELAGYVIARLSGQASPGDMHAMAIVSGRYRAFRANLLAQSDADAQVTDLISSISDAQLDYLEQQHRAGVIDADTTERFSAMLQRQGLLESRSRKPGSALHRLMAGVTRRVLNRKRAEGGGTFGSAPRMTRDEAETLWIIYRGLEESAFDCLNEAAEQSEGKRAAVASRLAAEHEATLSLMDDVGKATALAAVSADSDASLPVSREDLQDQIAEQEAEARLIELVGIRDMLQAGTIDKEQAAYLRERVYVMQMNDVSSRGE